MRARRGADVGSDHVLTIAKVKLKLCRVAKKNQRAPPLDVRKLKDPNVRRTYQTEIRNRFAVLLDQKEMDLYKFSQTLVEAGKKVLGQGGGRKKNGLQRIRGRKLKIERRRKERSFPPDLPD